MSWSRIKAIIWKEFIQIKRDKPSLAIAVMMPLMLMALFGYAVNTDVENIKTVVFDMDKSQASRSLIDAYEHTETFAIDSYVDSYSDLEKYLDGGIAKVGIVIPSGFSKNINKNEIGEVQMLVDGSDPLVASKATAIGQVIAQAQAFDYQKLRLGKQGVNLSNNLPLELKTRVWYNPDMDSIQFNVPGLIGLILQNITLMLTAFALVRERERGTLEQIIITPIKKTELIIGKLVPYIFVGFFDVILVLLVGVFIFGVKIKGDLILLLALSLLFLWCALGFGLLISTIAKTQLQALQMCFMFILPSVLLSGFMFPRESMPKVIYLISNAIPLTYFLNVLRGIILKGNSISYLGTEIFWLAVLSIFVFVFSILRFSKKLD